MSLSKQFSEWLPSSLPKPTLLAAGVVSSLLAVWYWRHQAGVAVPPGTKPMPHLATVPILGSIPFLPDASVQSMPDFLIEQGKKYGDVFDFYMGSSRIVVLNSFDAIQEALVQKANDFSSRPRYYTVQFFNDNQLGIIDKPFDQQLKENRHVSLTILKDFGFGRFQMMESRIAREVDELLDVLASENGQPFNPSHHLTLCVSNVINSIAFDTRFAYDDEEFHEILETMDVVIKNTTELIPIDFFPLLRFVPRLNRILWTTIDDFGKVTKFIQKQLDRHIQERTYESGEHDFTDAFINHYSIDEVDRENLHFILRDFFLAGAETTATTLKWAFIYVANRPSVQQRCYDELMGAFGSSRPSYEERANVPYCRAVLHEIQRLSCIVPLSLPHTTTTDTQVAGFHVPKDTVIFPNLWSSHMDETEFPDARTFNPDRFIDEDGNFAKSRKVIPFSLGRRSCLGEIVAKQELFLFFTSIVKQFTILPHDEDKQLSEQGDMGFANFPKPFSVRAVKRQ